jgi:hypothetical protein
MSKLLWMAFQAAIVGGVLFLFYGTEEGRRQNLGSAPMILAVGLAWLATIIPVTVIEGIKDVWRIYLPALRRWSTRRRVAAARRLAEPGQGAHIHGIGTISERPLHRRRHQNATGHAGAKRGAET